MHIRRAAAALAVPLLTLVSLTTLAPSALGDAGDDPVTCTIVDTSPDTIVLGTTTKRVQFDVGTDCDDDVDVSWSAQAENYYGSAHVSWLAVCNYDRPADPAVFDCTHGGSGLMNMVGNGDWTGNDMAGTSHPLYAAAWNDADGDNRVDNGESGDSYTGSFTLLRATTFGSTFDAGPEPVHKNSKLSITGSIKYADWDSGTYQKFGTYLSLQFLPLGGEDYQEVKQVWDNGVDARTTVKADESGTWRYHYAGDATHAPSNSKGDYVKVSAPAHSAPARRIITPGAYCKDSELGDIAYSRSGTRYRCSWYPSSHRNRWKRA